MVPSGLCDLCESAVASDSTMVTALLWLAVTGVLKSCCDGQSLSIQD